MGNFNMFRKAVLLGMVFLLMFAPETEARRRIVKGRKAITRTYYKQSAIPPWAVILLVGIGQLVIGAALYLGLKVLILDQQLKPRYVPAPTIPGTP